VSDVKSETGEPHYWEVLNLLDAIFRAARKKFTMTEATLRGIVARDTETAEAGLRKVNSRRDRR
jgi:hypothetical protein